MIRTGRIARGIAIENKRHPFGNSASALAGLNAEVRLADGLAGLRPCEAESLSICGMGGRRIVEILNAFPDRVPPNVTLQPNRHPELIRAWGIERGFRLVNECVADTNWAHQVFHFQRSDLPRDPAYEGLDRDAAILFGPLMLKRRDPALVRRLREEMQYFDGFDRIGNLAASRLSAIRRVSSSLGL